MKCFGFILICFCYLNQLQSQNTKVITPGEDTYSIDVQHKIIVWNKDISIYEGVDFDEIKVIFSESIIFSEKVDSLSYSKRFDVGDQSDLFRLYITKLPLIKINSDKTIVDDPKVASNFSYVNRDSVKKAIAGIEFRGNISLKFPKKSYDLEFWDAADTEDSRDMQFGDLREDDDWILDGLYNEPLRLRSYFCNKLWLSIHKPAYLNQEKEAKSGIDLMYVEVFVNSIYKGIYALTEQVDRKLLKLKKHGKSAVFGELFKASSYKGAPAYKSAPKYRDIFPHWAGYEMEYPVVNYKSYWKNIYKFTKFVVQSKDQIFKKKIARKFYLDNAIDYFLFINLIRATDNLGKNFYVARYDKNTPYFNIPWDLDGVLGTIQDGKRIPTTDDILSNGLFDRLLEANPDNYRQRLKDRWFKLRKGEFSKQRLFSNLRDSYTYFEKNKVYERETLIWSSDISMAEHLEYLEQWLTKRLTFLDRYFEELS